MCKNEANCLKLNNFRRAILYSTGILPLNRVLGALKEKILNSVLMVLELLLNKCKTADNLMKKVAIFFSNSHSNHINDNYICGHI